MSARPFSVVIYGATGFTGGLVAQYLGKNAVSDKTTFAIAGRDEKRLSDLKKSLTAVNPECKSVGIIIASSDSPSSLNEMCKQTKVVLSTVGPFLLYGEPLVAACVENGTHYCDITGETPFVKRYIAKYHALAAEKKIRICSMCGFDSIPADVGTLMIVEYMRRKWNAGCRFARAYVTFKGGASGGTLHSAINLGKEPLEDFSPPFCINPAGTEPDPKILTEYSKDLIFPVKDKLTGQWVAPFVMAVVNSRVVRRSQALYLDGQGTRKDDPHKATPAYYGSRFEYSEVAPLPFLVGAVMSIILGVVMLLTRLSIGRWILSKVAPKQGTGPSEIERAKSWFSYRFIAQTDEPKPREVRARIAGGCPGYSETAKMLAECGLCLANDEKELPERYGCLTPAAAMGIPLLNRLRKAGLLFEIESE